MSRSSIALSNLRAVVIVIVLAFHAVLAYLASLPTAPYRFDDAPYRWQAIPIVDNQRFFGFDLFCAWQDVSLMSLMFFLSGLFVPSSLTRKGGMTFLSDRFFRIGLPLAAVVVFLMPLTYYPTYSLTAADLSVSAYWQHLTALPFWPCGPQWFLWQLLAMNVMAAGLHRFVPGWAEGLARLAGSARAHPVRFFGGLVAISALAYVPLALAYTPWEWTSYGPFSFQIMPRGALSGLFLRRLRGRRLWHRPRAARHRWLTGAELGRLAWRFGRGLCAVGLADVADGGWRPGAAPRADRRCARFRRGLRVRLLRSDGAMPSFRR